MTIEYELTDQLITEAFDSDAKYPVVNLKPKAKTPSLFGLTAGNDKMVVSIQNFTTKGDSTKQVKPGDKFAQVVLLSLSDKGSLAELKGGLGSDPIGVINTVTDLVLDVMKDNHMDGVLFRFPAKKMKGKEKTINRILSRVVQQRSGGQFVVLEEMAHFAGKYSYFMIYRKAKGLTGIKELGIDTTEFTVTKTPVGEVVKEIKTGKEVTKAEAIAKSVTKKAEEKAPAATAAAKRNDIAKKELVMAFATRLVRSGITPVYAQYGEPTVTKGKPTKIQTKNVLTQSRALRIVANTNMSPADKKAAEKILMNRLGSDPTFVASPLTISNILQQAKENMSKSGANAFIFQFLSTVRDVARENYEMWTNFTQGEYPLEYYYALKDITSKSGSASVSEVLVVNRAPTQKDGDTIRALDKAFKTHGQQLPEGTLLYRGKYEQWKMVHNALSFKAFYFNNFLSCSLSPVIFSNGQYPIDNTDELVRDIKAHQTDVSQNDLKKDQKIGFLINPGDVPCLIPGKYTDTMDECEVLMPRGVVLKILAASGNKKDSIVMAVKAEHISQYNESDELYDGDALITEGVIRPLSFNKFVTVINEKKNDESSSLSSADLNVLQSIFSLADTPEKFA